MWGKSNRDGKKLKEWKDGGWEKDEDEEEEEDEDEEEDVELLSKVEKIYSGFCVKSFLQTSSKKKARGQQRAIDAHSLYSRIYG